MKITNKYGLPDAIVRAVQNDSYSKGDADYSVTELLSPPRQIVLKRKYWDELEEDVSDRIWSMHGQAMHTIAERANHEDIAERRLSITVQGKKISGGMDLYKEKDKCYIDYKNTSVWKVKNGDFKEWTEQLNLYAVILRENKIPIEKMQALVFLRDWSKMEASRDSSYPQSQVTVVDIELWSEKVAMEFLLGRLILHLKADLSLPECSKSEQWAKDDVWAVKKTADAPRAIKLFSDETLAKRTAETNSCVVEHRPGQLTRCAFYCNVASHCEQYQNTLKEKK